jgi:hypothetical protein
VQSPASPPLPGPASDDMVESEEDGSREESPDRSEAGVSEDQSGDEGSDMETQSGGNNTDAEDEGFHRETSDGSSDTGTDGAESQAESRDHGPRRRWYYDPDRITVLLKDGGDLTRGEIAHLLREDGSLGHHIDLVIDGLEITAVDALRHSPVKLQLDDLHALANAFANREDIQEGLPVSSDNIRILLDAIGLERVQEVLHDAQQLGGLTAILQSTEVCEEQDYRLPEPRMTADANLTLEVPSEASTSTWRDPSASKAGASRKRKDAGIHDQSRKRPKYAGVFNGESGSEEDVRPLPTQDTEDFFDEQNRYDAEDSDSDDDSSSNRRDKGKARDFF